MNFKKLFTLFILLSIIIGCTSNDNRETLEQSPPVEMTKISNKNTVNQDKSNRAKEILKNNKNITHAYAVNSADTLFVAIEIPHRKRFRLKKIEKELTKQMKKKFPRLDVHLSTDKKIILELEKLENKLKSSSMSKKDLKKRLQRIINLSKEKT